MIFLLMQDILVDFQPLLNIEWHGIPRGYNISYRPLNDIGKPTEEFDYRILTDHNANFFLLDDLEEFVQYEVTMQAFNDVGSSDFSPLAVERTHEAGNIRYICVSPLIFIHK